jgi:hypothetical protein
VGGHEVGLLGGTTPFWTGGSTLTAMGTYTDTPGVSSYLWNSSVSGSGSQDGVTADFRGYTAGIWRGGVLDGNLLGFYTTSDGKAGYLTGSGYYDSRIGSYYDGLKMWRGDVYTSAGELVSEGRTGLRIAEGAPWYFGMNLSGQYVDETGSRVGQILGQGVLGDRLYLTSDQGDLPYRVERFLLSGKNTYSGKPSYEAGWTADVGGVSPSTGTNGLPLGYYLGSLSGSWGSDGRWSGSFGGQYLTATEIGSLGGNLTGLGDDGTGTWIGQSLVSYGSDATPLVFSGVWGGQPMENGLATLYYNDGTGQMVVGGHEVGLLGGTTPFWTGGSTLVAMGTYTDTPGVSSYLWNSAVSGSGSRMV